MGNNRKHTKGRRYRLMPVFNESPRIFIETYLTPKGKKLLAQGMPKKEVNEKYQKKRYRRNPACEVISWVKVDSWAIPQKLLQPLT